MDTKVLCMGILYRQEASGYEIKKSCEEGPFAHIHATSFGSIYPALGKLEAAGLVACTAMPQEKRPDKKIYRLTDKGRRTFHEALLQEPAGDRVRSDFLFLLFFGQLLPSDTLAGLLDQRIAWYREALERMQTCDTQNQPAGPRFVHGLGCCVYQASLDYLLANRDTLLSEVEAAEARAAE
jgi:DNA-binding PadR family transcriptional regulator